MINCHVKNLAAFPSGFQTKYLLSTFAGSQQDKVFGSNIQTKLNLKVLSSHLN